MKNEPRTALVEAADIPGQPAHLIQRLLHRLRGARRPPVLHMAAEALPSKIDPHVFEDTAEGSAAFGHWSLDSEKLPCYVYEMNQYRDVSAYYVNTEGRDRREHWHQIGNHAVTALASNEGTVQVYLAHRGGVFLNYAEANDRPRNVSGYLDAALRLILRVYGLLRARWIRFRTRKAITPRMVAVGENAPAPASVPPDDHLSGFAFAGGFGYLDDGAETWATAYRYAPPKALPERIFGIGYFQTETIYRDIRQTRWVYAPFRDDPGRHGDDAMFLVDVEIENRRPTEVDIQYYEYWDVNIRQMQISWLRTGLEAPLSDNRRALINEQFDPGISALDDPQALRFHQALRAGVTLQGLSTREVDGTPFDVFLANLNPTPAACYVDKAAFFGKGGATHPDAVTRRIAPDAVLPTLGGAMPYCLIMRHSVHLKPGEKVTLRYAFGAVRPGEPLTFLKRYVDHPGAPGSLDKTRRIWKKRLPAFSTGSDPVLQRETTWHAYNLLSATLYSEYFDGHYTPQGSAYLYLHGAEGVPRDQSLFSMAMTYVCPVLARETLALLLGLRAEAEAGLALPYGYVGNGAVVTSTLHFHQHPSDLDLFILLGMSEYLAATGDMAFLDVEIPLYRFDGKTNPAPPKPVLEHLRLAVEHLDQIGVGRHSLLKIGDGDWDDGIVITNVLSSLKTGRPIDFDKSVQNGESVPNTQMADYVLRLAAAILDQRDPDLAAHMRDKAQALRSALVDTHQYDAQQHWFYRAYLRYLDDSDAVLGDHHLSLQAQVWPIISGLAADMQIEPQLIDTIKTLLDDPSPTGAMLEQNGQIWPAVAQLVTWAYTRSHPDLAWRSLNRQTFAAHAITFPNIWHNVWSGPDGTNSKGSPNAGGTWTSLVTPMTDFPVMNSNQDAMALLGLLRVCGIEPSMRGDGLDIKPQAPPERFVLDTWLLRLEVDAGQISGEYRATRHAGHCTLHVHLPRGASGASARVNDQPIPAAPDAAVVDLPLTFTAHQKIPFVVRWS